MLDVGLDRLRGMKGTRATDVTHDGLKAYFQSVSTSVGMLDIFPSLDVLFTGLGDSLGIEQGEHRIDLGGGSFGVATLSSQPRVTRLSVAVTFFPKGEVPHSVARSPSNPSLVQGFCIIPETM